MKFRITVLCENTVGSLAGTLGEHGFSVLVEPSGVGESLLFDTGQGLTLLHNAGRMNKDLFRLRNVVISHGHYDHAGGLMPLLKACGPLNVFGHPGIFDPRYRVRDTGQCYSIGMPDQRHELEVAGAVFDLSDSFRQIAPGIHLTGTVPRVTDFETGDRGLYRDCNGCEQDNTMDDQSLILEGESGLVVVLGCCHAGLVNTLKHVITKTGRQDIYAVIGGTHLGFSPQEQIVRTIATVKTMGIQKLAVSHCTGFDASARLSREMPREFQVAMVGYTLEL
jgi:7,8-dihydropterin-6-yl-methyl-4-(beta-D-ribofuranosyl)aminobenzene 5'-phosphate synthase